MEDSFIIRIKLIKKIIGFAEYIENSSLFLFNILINLDITSNIQGIKKEEYLNKLILLNNHATKIKEELSAAMFNNDFLDNENEALIYLYQKLSNELIDLNQIADEITYSDYYVDANGQLKIKEKNNEQTNW